MTNDRTTRTYDPPVLRALGSVHELTQGNVFGNAPDGFLVLQKTVTGSG
jgi:hypothetical protein